MPGEVKREIDTFPEPRPAERRKMKLVVATVSRTGTLSLYKALKVLGYKPYHMSEVVGSGGVQHLKIFEEAVRAHSNLFSGIRKYDRADFDRWWGEYDAVLEMPCFLGMDALEAYIEDRDVKFILMERDPDSWVASWNNTVPHSFTYMGFPSNILNYFDLFRLWILRLNATLYLTVSNGTLPGDRHNRDILRRFYTEYIARAKRTLPEDRTLVVKLEDGFGWEQICPFLEKPVPREDYPHRFTGDKFNQAWNGLMTQRGYSAARTLATYIIPVLGLGIWTGIMYA